MPVVFNLVHLRPSRPQSATWTQLGLELGGATSSATLDRYLGVARKVRSFKLANKGILVEGRRRRNELDSNKLN